jgi:hypothetical protein
LLRTSLPAHITHPHIRKSAQGSLKHQNPNLAPNAQALLTKQQKYKPSLDYQMR